MKVTIIKDNYTEHGDIQEKILHEFMNGMRIVGPKDTIEVVGEYDISDGLGDLTYVGTSSFDPMFFGNDFMSAVISSLNESDTMILACSMIDRGVAYRTSTFCGVVSNYFGMQKKQLQMVVLFLGEGVDSNVHLSIIDSVFEENNPDAKTLILPQADLFENEELYKNQLSEKKFSVLYAGIEYASKNNFSKRTKENLSKSMISMLDYKKRHDNKGC